VSHPSEENRWQRSRDLMNSEVRRIKAQVLSVQSCEARGHGVAKEREDCRRSSEEDRWREIERYRKLESLQAESPTLGTQSCEGAREREKDSCWIWARGELLDPHEGSCIGTSQGKVQEFGCGDCEVARRRYPDSWRQCGP
jgi:hypothetical protein